LTVRDQPDELVKCYPPSVGIHVICAKILWSGRAVLRLGRIDELHLAVFDR
jgi:hypothetical protein